MTPTRSSCWAFHVIVYGSDGSPIYTITLHGPEQMYKYRFKHAPVRRTHTNLHKWSRGVSSMDVSLNAFFASARPCEEPGYVIVGVCVWLMKWGLICLHDDWHLPKIVEIILEDHQLGDLENEVKRKVRKYSKRYFWQIWRNRGRTVNCPWLYVACCCLYIIHDAVGKRLSNVPDKLTSRLGANDSSNAIPKQIQALLNAAAVEYGAPIHTTCGAHYEQYVQDYWQLTSLRLIARIWYFMTS
jgi:hypothetical protein